MDRQPRTNSITGESQRSHSMKCLSAMLAATFCLCLAGGCGKRRDPVPSNSVTVKLPPPRPATAQPGFRFDDAPGNKTEDR